LGVSIDTLEETLEENDYLRADILDLIEYEDEQGNPIENVKDIPDFLIDTTYQEMADEILKQIKGSCKV